MIAVAFNANLVKSPLLIREITFAFFGPQLLRDGTRQILPLYSILLEDLVILLLSLGPMILMALYREM